MLLDLFSLRFLVFFFFFFFFFFSKFVLFVVEVGGFCRASDHLDWEKGGGCFAFQWFWLVYAVCHCLFSLSLGVISSV